MGDKAVILFSGGLDSTTLLYDIINDGYIVFPVVFDYGQKHLREIEKSRQIARKLNLNLKIVDMRGYGEIISSALTSNDIHIPMDKSYNDIAQNDTVVPNRNMVMLSVAAGYASSIGAKYVFTAVHHGDYIIYKDCREDFINNMNITLESEGLDVKIRAPYLNMTKSDIINVGLKLEVPYIDTWTCYVGDAVPCGRCGSCIERAEAFKTIGLNDPALKSFYF